MTLEECPLCQIKMSTFSKILRAYTEVILMHWNLFPPEFVRFLRTSASCGGWYKDEDRSLTRVQWNWTEQLTALMAKFERQSVPECAKVCQMWGRKRLKAQVSGTSSHRSTTKMMLKPASPLPPRSLPRECSPRLQGQGTSCFDCGTQIKWVLR